MGKKGQRQFTYRLFSLITGIKTKMLLIVFLGLIAKLTLVSGQCEVGDKFLKNFDFRKVCISILTPILKQTAFKSAARPLYFVCGSINNHSIEHIRVDFRVLE
jgi:hypothetical protein